MLHAMLPKVPGLQGRLEEEANGFLRLASCACLVRFGNGNLVRAWRVALSDSMILPKTRFLKACVRMGYAKKAKEIWKILDKDESGFATIDELDPKGAEEP